MRVYLKTFGMVFGLGIAAMALVGASAASAAGMTMAELKAKVQGKTLTIGFGSPPNLAEVVSVKAAQILKDELGINVTYKPLPADVEAAAVISGSLDAAEVSLGRLAGLKQAGADPYIFASNDYRNDYVLVAKAPIKVMTDLKGKIYGDAGAAGTGTFLRQGCFDGSGVAVADTKFIQLATSGAVATAIATPQLDAAMIHADAAANLNVKFPGVYNTLCYAYQKAPVANDVWYSTGAWVKAHPELALAITVASLKASRWFYASRDEWLKTAKSYVPAFADGVPEATYDVYAQIQLWDVNGALDMKDCNYNMQLLVQVKSLTSPLDCASFVTTDFQTQAREIVGMEKQPTPVAAK